MNFFQKDNILPEPGLSWSVLEVNHTIQVFTQ